VDVHLHMQDSSGASRAHYVVTHGSQHVGVTSENFGRILFRTLRTHRRNVVWPTHIRNLHVECVDTVAGTEAAGIRSGLGPAAIWLRVRVAGLGHLDFKEGD
jgi:hypothetical protein